MPVHDAIDTLIFILQLNIVQEGTQVVPQVQFTGGTRPRKYSFHDIPQFLVYSFLTLP
jgi:hypothetical protein